MLNRYQLRGTAAATALLAGFSFPRNGRLKQNLVSLSYAASGVTEAGICVNKDESSGTYLFEGYTRNLYATPICMLGAVVGSGTRTTIVPCDEPVRIGDSIRINLEVTSGTMVADCLVIAVVEENAANSK